MNDLTGWRTLVKLKQRRLAQLDEALGASRQQLREQLDALAKLLEAEAQCRAEAQAQHARLVGLATDGGPFRPSDVVTLQHLLAEAEQGSLAAAQRVRQGEQQVEAARQRTAAAQQALQRGERQLDSCRQKLEAALAAIQAAQDDQQDEEAEEASVARLLAAQRAAAAVAAAQVH
jgi:DNA repair exonuclease SbcCD ATPase subunit